MKNNLGKMHLESLEALPEPSIKVIETPPESEREPLKSFLTADRTDFTELQKIQ